MESVGYLLEELRNPETLAAFKADVESANMFIGSLIFVQELAEKVVEVVSPLRDKLDAVLVFPSMPDVMRLNKVRHLTSFLLLFATRASAWAVGSSVRVSLLPKGKGPRTSGLVVTPPSRAACATQGPCIKRVTVTRHGAGAGVLIAMISAGWLLHHGTNGSIQVCHRRVHEAEA